MPTADNWCVKVDDKVFGPYSSAQLRKFAHEGRVARWSMIAPAGARSFRKAEDEPAFASFFGASPAKESKDKARSFGKRDAISDKASDTAQNQANFIIILDAVSGAARRAELAIASLGPYVSIADNAYSVRCKSTAIGVRNAIAPSLLRGEPIFVVDATNGRTAWQNYAPEAHAKLTAALMAMKKSA